MELRIHKVKKSFDIHLLRSHLIFILYQKFFNLSRKISIVKNFFLNFQYIYYTKNFLFCQKIFNLILQINEQSLVYFVVRHNQ